MSRLVHEVSSPVMGEDGVAYTARVRGDESTTGLWQGWIEFLPQGGGQALRTGRETTQSRYDHLEYWASGLSPSYLEMALRRAQSADPEAPPPPLAEPTYDPALIRQSPRDSSVVRLELETLDPALPRLLMKRRELRTGQVRRIEGGGILVYDGVEGEEGHPSRHAFLLQYGSENAAAVLANHLWSELHGQGAVLRVEGEEVPLDNHLLGEALRARLPG